MSRLVIYLDSDGQKRSKRIAVDLPDEKWGLVEEFVDSLINELKGNRNGTYRKARNSN